MLRIQSLCLHCPTGEAVRIHVAFACWILTMGLEVLQPGAQRELADALAALTSHGDQESLCDWREASCTVVKRLGVTQAATGQTQLHFSPLENHGVSPSRRHSRWRRRWGTVPKKCDGFGDTVMRFGQGRAGDDPDLPPTRLSVLLRHCLPKRTFPNY